MTSIKIGKKTYKIKFGYNSFCDTDLMDRVQELIKTFDENEVESEDDVSGLGKVKDLFCCVRELLFVGFKKYNEVDTLQVVGDLLDDYLEDGSSEEERGIFPLFNLLAEELLNEGFLGNMLNQMTEQTTEATVVDIQKK